MRRIAILLMLPLLAGCGFQTLHDAKQSAADQLLDPKSAQFRNVRLIPDAKRSDAAGLGVCGEINGKNAYGAYAGFKRFVARRGETAKIEGDTGFDDLDLDICFREGRPG